MERTSESESEWNALLGRPFSKDKGSAYSVAVSVAYEGEKSHSHGCWRISSHRIEQRSLLSISHICGGGLRVFCLAGETQQHYSRFLRRASRPAKDPTSLGRTQMAFWFFVVAAAYGFIWLTTCNVQSLTGSALILIGISAGTGLSSAAVSSTKTQRGGEQARATK